MGQSREPDAMDYVKQLSIITTAISSSQQYLFQSTELLLKLTKFYRFMWTGVINS